MSVIAVQPSIQTTEPIHVFRNNPLSGADLRAPRTTARRFPEAFRAPAVARRRRCLRDATAPRALRSLPEPALQAVDEARRCFEEDPPENYPSMAAQQVFEKLFPPELSTLGLGESVAAVVHATAPAVLEVLAGARPVRQLNRALSPDCLGKLEAHMLLSEPLRPDPTTRCYSNPRVMCMRVTQVLPLVFEAAVILRDMQKVRATALRVERWHGRWQITALEIG
ncbi:hypothetical protein CGQ24_07700 [Arthrobacter sp. 7749]|nr:hypothetical protein CGQ24_07700 [Arthrobacter sp. 7749]